METSTWIVSLLLLVGATLITVACMRYAYRTHDVRGVVLFWSKRLVFTSLESAFQRGGIALMFLGVTLRYIQIFT